VSIITVSKVSGGYGHPFQFHSTRTPFGGCRRTDWFLRYFFPSSFLLHVVGVVCLYGRLT